MQKLVHERGKGFEDEKESFSKTKYNGNAVYCATGDSFPSFYTFSDGNGNRIKFYGL